MSSIPLTLTRKLWPDIDSMPDEIQTSGVANVISVIYSTPILLVGLVWLIFETRLDILAQNWLFFALLGACIYALDKFSFFVTIETGNGRYLSSEGSLDTVITWSAIFLFGPTALWLVLLFALINFFTFWKSSRTTGDRWNTLRNLTLGGAVSTFGILIALQVYVMLGGTYPISGLDPQYVIPALITLLIFFALTVLLYSGFIFYVLIHRGTIVADNSSSPIVRIILLAIALPSLANPVAILAAGLYVQNTFFMFVFLLVGLFLVAVLARKLSMEAEFSRQRARQLEKLESLGEAIINSPPDASSLPQLLEEFVPGMFPGRIMIWVAGDQVLLRYPSDWDENLQALDTWLHTQEGAVSFVLRDPLPWSEGVAALRPTVVCPIYDTQEEQNIGGIWIETRRVLPPWGQKELRSLYPPLYTLASQISSALHRAERYAQLLEYQSMSQELTLAGRIQASFLPDRMPDLPGWQLAVSLLPARSTTGDFFDFIQLSEFSWAIIIADVADKGIGPALYMALSRTLLRTFAAQYPDEPERVMHLTNQRILSDARAHLFVTLFYGILDAKSGTLMYCNAGHNPPLLFRSSDNPHLLRLDKTGIPIGIDEDATWEYAQLTIQPEDVLVLYTDGITEAQNQEGGFFDEDLLQEAVEDELGGSAYDIQSSILTRLQDFVGDYAQTDDITLMVLSRNLNHQDE
ncbi:MAG: SpoIIE family protein phosphatase [Anaerolineales bacterium]|jgi:serine phosphatase RsbU (regulator of sigma subunit)